MNGREQGGILRLNADGSVDESFQPGSGPALLDISCCPYVYAIALLPDGRILVGGVFDTVSGEPRKSLARLNSDGGLDPAFATGVELLNGDSHAVEARVQVLVPDGAGGIFVGGYFHLFGGVPRNHLARLNPDGSVDPNFTPTMNSAGSVEKLIVQSDGRVLISGSFWFPPDGTVRSVARLDSDGTFDPTFPASQLFELHLLTQDSGDKLIGAQPSYGWFAGHYQPSPNIIRLSSDGFVDSTFARSVLSPGSSVRAALTLPDGDIVIAGDFATVNDIPRPMLARLYGGSAEPLRLVSVGFEQGTLLFQAQIPSGVRYSLEYSDSLRAASWQVVTNGVGDGTLKVFHDPVP
ncbi:MAG: delta-60 repeat domain-containing protein, partial [Verrucomicrobiales bacterium]|nr:delta-60 repeat domain-containing protein [Verrucomicrobiales bacterium]